MPWLLLAFAGPVCWAASVHFDKYLVERYFKSGSVVGLMVFTSVISALVMAAIWLFNPGALAMPARDAALMAVMGLLDTVALVFYMRALQTEDASSVVPFFQTVPIFGFALAFLILGETVSLQQGVGAVLIVAGGAVMSIDRRAGRHRLNRRLVTLMLACAFVFGLNTVIFKLSALSSDFWTTCFWQGVGQLAFGVGVMFIPHERRYFMKMLRENTAAVLGVNAINETLYLAGNLGSGYAVLFLPVAVVQAISSTTVMFVFLFGIALTSFFPALGREDLSRGNILRKALAIAIITVGSYLAGGSGA